MALLDDNTDADYFTATITSTYPGVDVKVLSYTLENAIFYLYGRNVATPHHIIEPINPPDPGPDSHEMVVKVFRCGVKSSLRVILIIVTQADDVLPQKNSYMYTYQSKYCVCMYGGGCRGVCEYIYIYI